MGKINPVMLTCINAAIANAKATKSREAIHAAVMSLVRNAGLSYGAAANILRVKSGLDTPSADEARALNQRGAYLGQYVTPVKDYKPVVTDPNPQPVKAKAVKPKVVTTVTVIPSDPNFFL